MSDATDKAFEEWFTVTLKKLSDKSILSKIGLNRSKDAFIVCWQASRKQTLRDVLAIIPGKKWVPKSLMDDPLYKDDISYNDCIHEIRARIEKAIGE